jgi:hypothetical protein
VQAARWEAPAEQRRQQPIVSPRSRTIISIIPDHKQQLWRKGAGDLDFRQVNADGCVRLGGQRGGFDNVGVIVAKSWRFCANSE